MYCKYFNILNRKFQHLLGIGFLCCHQKHKCAHLQALIFGTLIMCSLIMCCGCIDPVSYFASMLLLYFYMMLNIFHILLWCAGQMHMYHVHLLEQQLQYNEIICQKSELHCTRMTLWNWIFQPWEIIHEILAEHLLFLCRTNFWYLLWWCALPILSRKSLFWNPSLTEKPCQFWAEIQHFRDWWRFCVSVDGIPTFWLSSLREKLCQFWEIQCLKDLVWQRCWTSALNWWG
jgi:hypothetical protein